VYVGVGGAVRPAQGVCLSSFHLAYIRYASTIYQSCIDCQVSFATTDHVCVSLVSAMCRQKLRALIDLIYINRVPTMAFAGDPGAGAIRVFSQTLNPEHSTQTLDPQSPDVGVGFQSPVGEGRPLRTLRLTFRKLMSSCFSGNCAEDRRFVTSLAHICHVSHPHMIYINCVPYHPERSTHCPYEYGVRNNTGYALLISRQCVPPFLLSVTTATPKSWKGSPNGNPP